MSSSEHLLGLINTVLDIAKIEAGRMDVIPANFNLLNLAKQCANLAAPLLKPTVVLEKQLAPALGLIYSDQDKMPTPAPPGNMAAPGWGWPSAAIWRACWVAGRSIVIDEATRAALDAAVVVEPLGTELFKGKTVPVMVYAVPVTLETAGATH